MKEYYGSALPVLNSNLSIALLDRHPDRRPMALFLRHLHGCLVHDISEVLHSTAARCTHDIHLSNKKVRDSRPFQACKVFSCTIVCWARARRILIPGWPGDMLPRAQVRFSQHQHARACTAAGVRPAARGLRASQPAILSEFIDCA